MAYIISKHFIALGLKVGKPVKRQWRHTNYFLPFDVTLKLNVIVLEQTQILLRIHSDSGYILSRPQISLQFGLGSEYTWILLGLRSYLGLDLDWTWILLRSPSVALVLRY